MTSARRATLLVAGAYTWWGFSPVFWRELGSIAPLDQLSWRVVMGACYLVLVWLWRRANPFAELTRRHVAFGLFAALMIAINWAAFLWAVDNDQTVESALGYFLMPLVSVALGIGLLGEQLRGRQWLALTLGGIGLIWTLVVLGAVPWVAVILGISFAFYGWARKQGPWDAVNGLTFELVLIAPFFAIALSVRGASMSTDVAGDASLTTVALIMLTGAVTVVPLLLFASAAKQVSLTVVGLMQYINPVLQFLVAWQVFGESVSTGRFIGFAWIWAALAVVVMDEVRSQAPVDGRPIGSEQRIVGS